MNDSSSVDKVLLKSIVDYFNENPKHMQQAIKIHKREGDISLKMLEYYIIKYAFEKNECLLLENGENFIVHDKYKACLKSFHKDYFDFYCRKKKIQIKFGNEILNTAIGQLNILKWSLENGIVNHLEKVIKKETICFRVKKNNLLH